MYTNIIIMPSVCAVLYWEHNIGQDPTPKSLDDKGKKQEGEGGIGKGTRGKICSLSVYVCNHTTAVFSSLAFRAHTSTPHLYTEFCGLFTSPTALHISPLAADALLHASSTNALSWVPSRPSTALLLLIFPPSFLIVFLPVTLGPPLPPPATVWRSPALLWITLLSIVMLDF